MHDVRRSPVLNNGGWKNPRAKNSFSQQSQNHIQHAIELASDACFVKIDTMIILKKMENNDISITQEHLKHYMMEI